MRIVKRIICYLCSLSCGSFRNMEDFVTWVDSSKIRQHVLNYNDEVSSGFAFHLLYTSVLTFVVRLTKMLFSSPSIYSEGWLWPCGIRTIALVDFPGGQKDGTVQQQETETWIPVEKHHCFTLGRRDWLLWAKNCSSEVILTSCPCVVVVFVWCI